MQRFLKQIKYRFDALMAKGTGALIGALAVVSLIVILIAGLVVSLAGIAPEGAPSLSFGEAMWQSFMRSIDSGTVAGDSGAAFRLVMILVTIGGIFIFSLLIGILSNGMADKVESLRRGRSQILEHGHIVVLGWSSKIFGVIEELLTSNAENKRFHIVVLATREKPEMEELFRERFGRLSSKILCRNGDPGDVANFTMVNLAAAKSVLVLSDDDPRDGDVDVLCVLLAIAQERRRSGTSIPCVAELRNSKNLSAARIAIRDNCSFLSAEDAIARIMAQTCRQRGLSLVYTEILSYSGNEIYLVERPAYHGRMVKELLFAHENQSTLGLLYPDGTAVLNPPMHEVYSDGMKLIVLAGDDSEIGEPDFRDYTIRRELLSETAFSPAAKAEEFLVLYLNDKTSVLVRELDNYVPKGTRITLISPNETDGAACEDLAKSLVNLKLTWHNEDPLDRAYLDSISWGKITSLILFSDGKEEDRSRAESKTILSLLHVRDIMEKGSHSLSITTEILDIKNQSLLEALKVNDFVVSDHLSSQMLAQLSEDGRMEAVYRDLFDADGSEIYIKPAEIFVHTDTELSFAEIIEAGARKNMVVFGYKILADEQDASKNHGIVVNPRKETRLSFKPGDCLLVLAD